MIIIHTTRNLGLQKLVRYVTLYRRTRYRFQHLHHSCSHLNKNTLLTNKTKQSCLVSVELFPQSTFYPPLSSFTLLILLDLLTCSLCNCLIHHLITGKGKNPFHEKSSSPTTLSPTTSSPTPSK